ncbi:conserved hypothetical protein, membrane [Candidatus Magnetomorum sp. HK-1]|nr:conserved hypothetical protein, membrane [Candidatus Magnetomorum sp. HK-1]
MIQILSFIAILVAAILIGNWFLDEIKQSKIKGLPWYQPYISIPGIIIMIAIAFPIVIRILKK